MVGVEIDLVVKDSLKALAFYHEIFGVETLEVSNYDRGLNEAVFILYGTRFHLLDENPEYQLFAPKDTEGRPYWINVVVENIRKALQTALDNGASLIQDLVEMPEMGISNAIFKDPSGHLWMLHQINLQVSQEERNAYLESKFGKPN